MGAWFGNQREKRGLRDSEGLAFTDGWEQAVGYGGEFGPGGVGVSRFGNQREKRGLRDSEGLGRATDGSRL